MNNTDVLKILKAYIDKSIESVNAAIIASSELTAQSINDLNQTLINYDRRLREVEEANLRHADILLLMEKMRKKWYIVLIFLAVCILILIPVADVLGLTGILSVIKGIK